MSVPLEHLGTGLDGLLTLAARQPCVICGGEPAVVGAYCAEGDAAIRLGAAAGKTRIILYGLCDRHPLDDETASRAERFVEAALALDTPPSIVSVKKFADLDEITFFEEKGA